jgi:hypothetical protein
MHRSSEVADAISSRSLTSSEVAVADAISNDYPYEIKDAGVKGRGVFATRNISPGEVILSESPIAFYSNERCQACHLPATTRCSVCQDVFYCSRACQKAGIISIFQRLKIERFIRSSASPS